MTFYCYNCKAMVQLKHQCVDVFDWRNECEKPESTLSRYLQELRMRYNVFAVAGLAFLGAAIIIMPAIAHQTVMLLLTVEMTIQKYLETLNSIYSFQ